MFAVFNTGLYMYWKRLDKDSPEDGVTCIVGRIALNKKTTYGIYEYHHRDNTSCWVSKDGHIIACYIYDHWCDVRDIIDSVYDIFLEELRLSINKDIY